jgi:hypothetical protein
MVKVSDDEFQVESYFLQFHVLVEIFVLAMIVLGNDAQEMEIDGIFLEVNDDEQVILNGHELEILNDEVENVNDDLQNFVLEEVIVDGKEIFHVLVIVDELEIFHVLEELVEPIHS